nr:hypothetical protein [Tanacetum cinerariifolium]
MTNPEDITDPTTAMNMALALMAKAFKLNYSTPTNNNQRISSNPRNRQIAQPARPRRRDAAYLQTQLLIAQKEEAGIQLQAEEYDLMVAAADLDEIEEVNANCILMANLHIQAKQSTPTNNNQRISSNPRNRQIAQPGMNMGQDRQMQMVGGNGGNQFRQYAGQNAGNLNGYNGVQNDGNQNQIGNGNLVAVRAEGNAAGHNGNQIRCYNCKGLGHFPRDCTIRPRRRDAAYLQTQLLIGQKKEAGIQLQTEEYDLMAAVADLDEIKEVNANYILMANLQQASSTGTQTDSTPVYDTDGSAENDNNVIYVVTDVEQDEETVE